MLNSIYRFSDYLTYLLASKNRHSLHSPFVYSFNENVIHSEEKHPLFDLIETTRRKMIHSKTIIDFEDFGSGKKSGKRRLSEIASNTGRQAKYGRFLFHLLQGLKPEFSIELGTATGITALYQACALSPERPLHSIEGSQKLSEIAAYNAQQCGLENQLIFHVGNFDSVLPNLLQQMPRVDYAYIDGNHRYDPTLKYFDLLRAKTHPGTVLVFDDINYSEEMKNAWSAIKNDPLVSITIDLFAFGIVFFRPGQQKEHFTIRY